MAENGRPASADADPVLLLEASVEALNESVRNEAALWRMVPAAALRVAVAQAKTFGPDGRSIIVEDRSSDRSIYYSQQAFSRGHIEGDWVHRLSRMEVVYVDLDRGALATRHAHEPFNPDRFRRCDDFSLLTPLINQVRDARQAGRPNPLSARTVLYRLADAEREHLAAAAELRGIDAVRYAHRHDHWQRFQEAYRPAVEPHYNPAAPVAVQMTRLMQAESRVHCTDFILPDAARPGGWLLFLREGKSEAYAKSLIEFAFEDAEAPPIRVVPHAPDREAILHAQRLAGPRRYGAAPAGLA